MTQYCHFHLALLGRSLPGYPKQLTKTVYLSSKTSDRRDPHRPQGEDSRALAVHPACEVRAADRAPDPELREDTTGLLGCGLRRDRSESWAPGGPRVIHALKMHKKASSGFLSARLPLRSSGKWLANRNRVGRTRVNLVNWQVEERR